MLTTVAELSDVALSLVEQVWRPGHLNEGARQTETLAAAELCGASQVNEEAPIALALSRACVDLRERLVVFNHACGNIVLAQLLHHAP